MSKLQGKIKFYSEDRGYGFINQKNGEDVFVHFSGLIDKISENDEVSFDVVDGKKGKNAINVELIG